MSWPSVVFYETEYSVYVMRQAARRSWRIGQDQKVEVSHFVYDGTLQAQALALVAAKMRSALLIEGEIPEDGLAALEGDGQDIFLTLAPQLTDRATTSGGQSLEALFAETRAIEAEAEDLLVDGEWSPEEVTTAPAPPTAGHWNGPPPAQWPDLFSAIESVPAGSRARSPIESTR